MENKVLYTKILEVSLDISKHQTNQANSEFSITESISIFNNILIDLDINIDSDSEYIIFLIDAAVMFMKVNNNFSNHNTTYYQYFIETYRQLFDNLKVKTKIKDNNIKSNIKMID